MSEDHQSGNGSDAGSMQPDATVCNIFEPILSDLQQQAIDLMLSGKRDGEVARLLSIDRSTLWRWKTTHAAFRECLNQLRAERWTAAADRYHDLLEQASGVLDEQVKSGYREYRVEAAKAIFSMANRFRPLPPSRSTSRD